ncbi:MAG: TMEM175 family protein [Planctomycetota bacterium]
MSDADLPPAPRLLDRHFRWRGSDVSRLEGFSDAVFAIVLALLFLRAAPPETFTDLKAAMKALVPFAASFAIIAYVWIEHWLFSRRYDLHDGWTTFLNLLLLFLLLFYAYPLKFLFTLICIAVFGPIGSVTREHLLQGFEGEGDLVRLFVFYGVGYGAIFGVIALMYVRALMLEKRLGLNAVERFLTRAGIWQCLLQSGVAAVSIAVALIGIELNAGLPGWVYGAIGPAMAVHGMWEGRRVRALEAGART